MDETDPVTHDDVVRALVYLEGWFAGRAEARAELGHSLKALRQYELAHATAVVRKYFIKRHKD